MFRRGLAALFYESYCLSYMPFMTDSTAQDPATHFNGTAIAR